MSTERDEGRPGNPSPEMTDQEQQDYREWMFCATEDEHVLDPSDLDWDDEQLPAEACIQEWAWIAGYRFAQRKAAERYAEKWDEGHSRGWSDAQEAHDVRQEMDRADWEPSIPNPYREEQGE